jgi:hypothetical protein
MMEQFQAVKLYKNDWILNIFRAKVIEPYIGARGLGDSVRALDSTIEQL